ncbi:glycosyltransferase family 2 protein [Rhodoplanes sp. Z2-YC6860]|uniref:glycosyltransferase family 2 protein n=1 Tax=Rhodoplanes sp. Z2-YC6860 TaxID=674703 RepID=UPI00078E283D|nr:glycosyltransferase family 2 protein [Rhodoplanes sp. Z2-YC6860]AMN40066.1 hypothetical protein RHPLAN_16110 [Rhodoplanes sp. Z2-YC6860]
MADGELTRIDGRPIPDNRDEVRAFLVTWNDALRLQSVLDHYRQIGVSRFFVADLGSTDGTLEHLTAASDVHVFKATGDDSLAWLNTLLDAHGAGHWTVTVDSSELLVYPHYEELELPLFCRYLNHIGAQALACVSLDMYATGPLRDAVHRPGMPLTATCGYFDSAPYQLLRTDVCPHFEIYGGLRGRLMSGDRSPVLSRVPLVRWQNGMQYLRGTGHITPVVIANMMGALLRFDFLSDFRGRVGGELAIDESTNLSTEASMKFEGSGQLVRLGLMKSVQSFDESVKITTAARTAKSA